MNQTKSFNLSGLDFHSEAVVGKKTFFRHAEAILSPFTLCRLNVLIPNFQFRPDLLQVPPAWLRAIPDGAPFKGVRNPE
jgi:hypothetical protein